MNSDDMNSPSADQSADDDLRAVLADLDPARQGAATVDLTSLEAVMSEITRSDPASDTAPVDPPTPTRRTIGGWRRVSVAAVAAVAAVGIGVAGFTVGQSLRGDSTPVVSAPSVTLGIPADANPATSICAVLAPEMLADVALAFDGTVTALAGGVATLEVTKWYRGGDPATTSIAVAVPDPDLVALLGAPTFTPGERYLVSSDGQTIGLCGASGEYSPALAAIYAAAFG